MTANCYDQHLPRLTLAQTEPSTHDTALQTKIMPPVPNHSTTDTDETGVGPIVRKGLGKAELIV